MKKRNRNLNRGFALVSILILLGVLTMGLVFSFRGSINSLRFANFANKRVTRENIVASNYRRAESLMRQWGDEENVPKLDDIDSHPDGYTMTVSEGIPAEDGEYQTSVVIHPLKDNPDFSGMIAGATKKYVIESIAKHKRDGETFVMEAFVGIQLVSLTRIGFGILNSSTPGPHSFVPATYVGHMHFGKNVDPKFLNGKTVFRGPVTFEEGADYTKENYAEVKFEAGVTGNVPIGKNLDADKVIDNVCEHVSPSVASWQSLPDDQLCLKFNYGNVIRFQCKPKQSGFVKAMVYHPTGTVGNPWGPVFEDGIYDMGTGALESVPIPAGGLAICNKNANITIKGLYDGAITVAAKSVTIAGDLVSAKQKSRTYSLGIVAKEDVVIPMDVPNGDMMSSYWPNFSDHGWDNIPSPSSYSTILNIQSPTPDEDLNNPDYPLTSGSYSFYMGGGVDGAKNLPATLDIDAAILAMRRLDVQGLNPPAGFPGLPIPAVDPVTGQVKIYSSEPFAAPFTDPNTGEVITSLYKEGAKVDGIVNWEDDPAGPADPAHFNNATYTGATYNARPIYCALTGYDGTIPSTGNCAPGLARPRGRSETLWINGTLITNDFSLTQGAISGRSIGFDRKVINYDPLMEKYPPPYFPRLSGSSQLTVYSTSTHVSAPINVSAVP